ncbi:MAG: carboxypeptidase-like regulatory domain-containing protein, partial [Bacteroidaceae bacterium]|nr:carboxypeptidase-like regulatory domain-containing protein [Bacteroidaceae bacterium]
MMKTLLFTALICGFALCADAQKVSRNYLDVSLSKVLEDLNQAVEDKTIFFIYNELEDFTVTCRFSNLSIEDAIREVIGFYPMKVTYD